MDLESRLSELDESQLSNPPPSESDSSDSEIEVGEAQGRTPAEQQQQQPQQTQWLATTRARRSTAGNRMKSLLANEEPDSDLELLFAEDENDEGFSDAREDASDVQMDSSSDDDDDDDDNAGDELEGEKELERRAREEKRAAQRKRKARDAIPAKFRKRVRIHTAESDASTPTTPASLGRRRPGGPLRGLAPAPRPRKKSERLSWLPSPADLPTRASSRETTRLSKEQLHQQMVEREERRLRQLALMQKKAARMEALKKPPLTQEDRLREAAVVEKRNSKSLNRWEVAEKQREEERRAKLAALHQRTLRGPVITFWSGIGEARRAVVEEQEKPKKKRERTDKTRNKAADGAANHDAAKDDAHGKDTDAVPPASTTSSQVPPPPSGAEAKPAVPAAASREAVARDDSGAQRPAESSQHPSHVLGPPRLMAMPSVSPSTVPNPPGGPSPLTTSPRPGTVPPDKSSKPAGVLAAPILAPPPTMPVDFSPGNPKSNVLAPPNTSQLAAGPAPPPPLLRAHGRDPVSEPNTTTARFLPPEDVVDKKPASSEAVAPSAAEAPASASTTTRNAIILRNFDDNAIRDKAIQAQILFGRKMSRLTKPPPGAVCAITNLPARYRDPKTGLPYHNVYAYREIRRLSRGEHRFSKILNAWVGSGGAAAARGVPERFVDPGAPGGKAKADAGRAASEQQDAGKASPGESTPTEEPATEGKP